MRRERRGSSLASLGEKTRCEPPGSCAAKQRAKGATNELLAPRDRWLATVLIGLFCFWQTYNLFLQKRVFRLSLVGHWIRCVSGRIHLLKVAVAAQALADSPVSCSRRKPCEPLPADRPDPAQQILPGPKTSRQPGPRWSQMTSSGWRSPLRHSRHLLRCCRTLLFPDPPAATVYATVGRDFGLETSSAESAADSGQRSARRSPPITQQLDDWRGPRGKRWRGSWPRPCGVSGRSRVPPTLRSFCPAAAWSVHPEARRLAALQAGGIMLGWHQLRYPAPSGLAAS